MFSTHLYSLVESHSPMPPPEHHAPKVLFHEFPVGLRRRTAFAFNAFMIGALPVIALVLGVKVALDRSPWHLINALMLLPAAIVASMFIASCLAARTTSVSSLLLLVRHWFPHAGWQLHGALSTPVIVAEQIGTASPTLAFGSRLGGRLEIQFRTPAAAIRSVRWEPDSGSSTKPPTKEWLLLVDARKDVTPEVAVLNEQSRQMVARDGLRALAFVATHGRGHAEREGLRLVEFLRAVGLTLELDPTPSVEDPDTIGRTAPPTSPDEIGEPVFSPARLAAAAKRVRWRVLHAE